MTGPSGFAAQAHRPDDIESPSRRFGAWGNLLGLLIVSPPLPASMARCEAPARMMTLRVGSFLASPSGLRFSLSLRSTMTPVGFPATSSSVPSGNRRSTEGGQHGYCNYSPFTETHT